MGFIHIDGDTTYVLTSGLTFLDLPAPLAELEDWFWHQVGLNRGLARSLTLAVISQAVNNRAIIRAPKIGLLEDFSDEPDPWKPRVRLLIAMPAAANRFVHTYRRFMQAIPTAEVAVPEHGWREGEILCVPDPDIADRCHETDLPRHLAEWWRALNGRQQWTCVGMDQDAWWLARDWFLGWERQFRVHGVEIDHGVCLDRLVNTAGIIAMAATPERPTITAKIVIVAKQLVDYHEKYVGFVAEQLREANKVVPLQPPLRPPWETPPVTR